VPQAASLLPPECEATFQSFSATLLRKRLIYFEEG